MIYKTRDWIAHSWSKDFAGNGSLLTVTGEVQTTNTNQTPKLTMAEPQGINPAILLLKLTVSVKGPGNTVEEWKRVGYRQAENPGQYKSVEIIGDCDGVTVPVIPILS